MQGTGRLWLLLLLPFYPSRLGGWGQAGPRASDFLLCPHPGSHSFPLIFRTSAMTF